VEKTIDTVTVIPGIELVKWQNLTWVDIKDPDTQKMAFLAQNFSFHPLSIDDCLSKVHSPKFDDYEKYIFIILHFPILDKALQITVPSQMAVFVGKNFLVTVHSRNLKLLDEMSQNCRIDDKLCGDYMGKDACYLLYRILDRLVDMSVPVIDDTLSKLETIEGRLNNPKIDALQEVTRLRRNIAAQQRIIRMLRDVMSGLPPRLSSYTDLDLKVYFDDINDHLDHLWNDIEECHETIEIYKDNYSLLRQERSNKIMTVLTILFTISLPATILSTMFGMHVNIPWGTESTGWSGMLGTYTTFIIIASISMLLAFIMYIFFRRRRWL
jgi:magnesium transporter